jgi:hypothetical protein
MVKICRIKTKPAQMYLYCNKSELKIKSPTSNISLAILPSSYLNLYLCKLELMCLQSSTNRGLLDLLCANISGLTKCICKSKRCATRQLEKIY